MIKRGALPDGKDGKPTTDPVQDITLPRKRRWIVTLLIWVVALLVMFAIFSFMASQVSLTQLQSFSQTLKQADQSILQWIRLAFITILIGYWKPIITWMARRHDWSEARLHYTLKQRWVMLGVLAFVELLIVRQVHQLFLN